MKKAFALGCVLLFAGSPVFGKVCVLACAAPTAAPSGGKSLHSHCGTKSSSRSEPDRNPCGHAHRGEALVSSSPGASKTFLLTALVVSAGLSVEAPRLARNSYRPPRAAESPPTSFSVPVLRL